MTQWIDAKERKPDEENDGMVLAFWRYDNYGAGFTLAIYHSDTGEWHDMTEYDHDNNEWSVLSETVRYWMRIPDVPRES